MESIFEDLRQIFRIGHRRLQVILFFGIAIGFKFNFNSFFSRNQSFRKATLKKCELTGEGIGDIII